jgi:hypothetical protein
MSAAHGSRRHRLAGAVSDPARGRSRMRGRTVGRACSVQAALSSSGHALRLKMKINIYVKVDNENHICNTC